jgi:hypothetical protein
MTRHILRLLFALLKMRCIAACFFTWYSPFILIDHGGNGFI